MKHLILILALLPTMAHAQVTFPYDDDFSVNNGDWNFTGNGVVTSGWETYGVITTTLDNGLAYPNNSKQRMVLNVDLSQCAVNVDVSFGIYGDIEDGYDFMEFQYKVGSASWVTVDTYTGIMDSILNYSIPNTANKIRFMLKANGSNNTYPCGSLNCMYFYDIDFFKVTCASGLPVELTYFDGECGSLQWQTASENNNDYFLIAESLDGIVWRNIEWLEGQGTTTGTTDYAIDITGSSTMYYRLTQVDFDGASEVFPIISVDCNEATKEIVGYYDLMGRVVNVENIKGYYIILYTNGSTEKRFK